MRISQLVNENIISLKARNKNEVIDELINLLFEKDMISNKEIFKKAILKREEQSTTGIGFGVAIPHAKSEVVNFPAVALGISKDGIDYQSVDGETSKLFFMIAVNEGENELHLKALAILSRMLMHEEFRSEILNAENPSVVLEILRRQENNY